MYGAVLSSWGRWEVNDENRTGCTELLRNPTQMRCKSPQTPSNPVMYEGTICTQCKFCNTYIEVMHMMLKFDNNLIAIDNNLIAIDNNLIAIDNNLIAIEV